MSRPNTIEIIIIPLCSAVVCTLFMTVAVCPITSQQIVSANTDLLPPSGVQTTSESSLFNPLGNLVHPHSSPWCTAPHSNSRLVPDLQVTLSFTEPVRVSMIKSSGFINGYVNNFTIEYTATLDDDDYTAYVTATGTKVGLTAYMAS